MSVACGGGTAQGPVPPKATATATATPTPKAKHPYTIQPAANWPTDEAEADLDPTVMPFDPTRADGKASQLKARFAGMDRVGAKTSIVEGAQAEEFSSVVDLQSGLPDDDRMRKQHQPKISKKTMDRVPEEQRNVRVDAWVYAIKYESDNDWHLIIGTNPAGDDTQYFNAEVSGLPKKRAGKEAPSFETLLAVRRSLAEILNDDLPGPGSYAQYDPPFSVAIEGPSSTTWTTSQASWVPNTLP
jgi:hypothetical protein